LRYKSLGELSNNTNEGIVILGISGRIALPDEEIALGVDVILSISSKKFMTIKPITTFSIASRLFLLL
jgi:hypothetical protein